MHHTLRRRERRWRKYGEGPEKLNQGLEWEYGKDMFFIL